MQRLRKIGRRRQHFWQSRRFSRIKSCPLENGLRRALERDELVLHYQPQVNIHTGEIVGTEALIRWQHPQLGLVSPLEFIPLAEEINLIGPIGEWALCTACAQNKAWQDAGLKPLRMAANLSARQFRQPDLVEMVARVLGETGLEAAHPELELTESSIMSDADESIATLKEIRRMGVRVAVDDFGTGYSSLSYLKRLPLDVLKIDQSFVRDVTSDPDDALMVTAIIGLAHNLNLMVTAEGVETNEQLAFLRLAHCDEAQGYLLGRPQPAAAISQMLVCADAAYTSVS